MTISVAASNKIVHDDVIKWKHFPRYWPFVRVIHRSPVNVPHKGQWRGALMFSLICVWINGWVNNREAGDLRRYRAHYDVTVMRWCNHMFIALLCKDGECCCFVVKHSKRHIVEWWLRFRLLPEENVFHYGDVIMVAIASQITRLTIVYSTVDTCADQRKHQSSASLAFVWGIHRWPVNSPHKWPVTRKMFPFDVVFMITVVLQSLAWFSHWWSPIGFFTRSLSHQ